MAATVNAFDLALAATSPRIVNLSLPSNVSVSWSTQVSGAGKPSNFADVTSANTAAGIAGQGAFATVSQITGGNATSLIAANAVVGSLLATTGIVTSSLQIGTNLVTVPASGNTTADVDVTSSWQTFASATISTGPVAPTNVFVFSAVSLVPFTSPTSSTEDVEVGIFRDASLVESVYASSQGDRYLVVPMPFTDTSTLSASTNYTYSVRVRTVSGSPALTPRVGGSSIFVIGTKR